MKRLHVTWHDAHGGPTTWTSVEDLLEDPEPLVVESVGFELEGAKPDHIALVQSVTSADQVDHIIFIPRGMVKNVRVVQ